jgi:hypothetical protein
VEFSKQEEQFHMFNIFTPAISQVFPIISMLTNCKHYVGDVGAKRKLWRATSAHLRISIINILGATFTDVDLRFPLGLN